MTQGCTEPCNPPDTRDAPNGQPAVYVLRCSDGSLYTGATVDLPRRLLAHRRRKAAKYTRGRLPVLLLAWWLPESFSQAKSHEAHFKRLTRAEKLATLLAGVAYGCPIYNQVEE
ncbi:MAG TPA: GIY-YIG nuclease family protein [Candidatus Cybelea sp.]|nr:GIY-YIG nuclease family protein [Candidatus Cybelea sp.]